MLLHPSQDIQLSGVVRQIASKLVKTHPAYACTVDKWLNASSIGDVMTATKSSKYEAVNAIDDFVMKVAKHYFATKTHRAGAKF